MKLEYFLMPYTKNNNFQKICDHLYKLNVLFITNKNLTFKITGQSKNKIIWKDEF